MLHRQDFGMPSTTNSLESFHGHLNKKVPRMNEFWSSIHRLANDLSVNEESFNTKIKHNYNYIKRISIQKQQRTVPEKMKNEKEFYDSHNDGCLCSDNKLVSHLMKTDLPCYHRVECGTQYPKCPHSTLHIDEDFDHLKYKIQLIDSDNESIKDLDEYYSDKEYAIRIIIRYSNFKDIDKIRQFVDHSYCSANDSFYILGKPVSLIQMINEGISYFSDMLANLNELKNNNKQKKIFQMTNFKQ